MEIIRREILKFTPAEARFIVIDNLDPDYTLVDDIVEDDGNRFNEFHEIVIQRVSDGKYFKSFYNKELDNYEPIPSRPPYYDETEVEMKETFKTITYYFD